MTAQIKFTSKGKNYHYTVPVGESPCGKRVLDAIDTIYKELGIKKATNQQFTISGWNFWVGYI